MKPDDNAWRQLEKVAKTVNSPASRRLMRRIGRQVSSSAKTVAVGAFDRLVSRISGQEVNTRPSEESVVSPADVFAHEAPANARRSGSKSQRAAEPAASRRPLRIVDDAVTEAEPASAAPASDDRVEAEPAVAAAEDRSASTASDGDKASADRPEVEVAPTAIDAPANGAESIESAPASNASAGSSTTTTGSNGDASAESATTTASSNGAKPAAAVSAPQRYGIDRVVLLIRSATRAFAYWEIDPERAPEGAEGRVRLRDETTGDTLDEAAVDPTHGRHHFTLDGEPRSYLAEVVLIDGEGRETVLSTGRPAELPSIAR